MPKDRIIVTFFVLSLVALVASVAMIVVFLPSGTGQLVLHFDPQHEISLVGSKYLALFGAFLMLLVGVVNFVILREIYYRERFLSYLIAFMTLVLSILFLIVSGVVVAAN